MNPRYARLFEPVAIGPVTAPNRFYQTPHATGMGYLRPKAGAALRGIKAEGGWGVVCTEYCSIHPSSDDSPYAFLTLWDEDDTKALAKTAEAIHEHGSLAGIELWHGGAHSTNKLTREPMLAPSARPSCFMQPPAARALDKADIRAFRRWQAAAAKRAVEAGFDIVYVYAGHDYLPFQFLSPRTNRRADEYGGKLGNRARLLREMLEETREAIGPDRALAIRLAVTELHGPTGITHDGEAPEIVSMLAEIPDLWDVNVAGGNGKDSKSARFSPEGYQEQHVQFVKSLTTKPVVGVGRFTSPDTMIDQIKRGVLDLIGAARPSIADPFLPAKIREGREDEIRECIGCNICRSANNEGVPLRCTQNPTMGEEWRRGWHPERIPTKRSDRRVLVVGAGPAGLECALALGRRGYEVALAEAGRELGGRLLRDSTLPGLGTWIRVRDWRAHMLGKLPHVSVFRESELTAENILGLGYEDIALATGSRWRHDAIGTLMEEASDVSGLTPDDIFAGATITGSVVIYDDDHYYMGSALAERLAAEGHQVELVTPAPIASAWTEMTNEQDLIQARLIEAGVNITPLRRLMALRPGEVETACVYTDARATTECGTLVLVTGRIADDMLYTELTLDETRLKDASIRSVTRIGDCLAPSSIADAVFSGHRFAREFGENAPPAPRRERPPH
ncbi:MAG: FAD-dependent oxidoreductase [Paracoccaceae bacterium]|nr:FAD-dependent oxidoreductase [Paracoccaceae bacterium]